MTMTDDDLNNYVPFFTDHYHSLLHEMAYYYELPNRVADIKALHVRGLGSEVDGSPVELDLGLEGIDGVEKWEAAKKWLAEMGFGAGENGGGGMGEEVVVVIEV